MTIPEKDLSERRNIEALCVAKGMRMTEQRRVIARVLAGSEDHPDVEELYRRCAKVDDRISDRKSTRLNSSHIQKSRMPSSA